MAGPAPGSEPSVIALARDAVRDFSVIVKGEIALAQAELKRQATNGAIGGFFIFIMLLLLSVAGLFASVALALGLNAAGVWLWLSFLIVSALYVVFAVILLAVASYLFRKIKGPETAKRIAIETRAYLQAALAPTETIDVTVTETETVVGADGVAVEQVTSTTRSVTLPARRPDATQPGPTDPGAPPQA